MTLATTLLLTAHFLAPPAHQIDFRLMPTGPAEGQTSFVQPPVPEPATATTQNRSNTAISRPQARPAVALLPVVQGFGTDVPLSFAVRQIVPEGFRVRFGIGAETDALVSWWGNKPWNRALQDAIRPLRLRMTLAGKTVMIAR